MGSLQFAFVLFIVQWHLIQFATSSYNDSQYNKDTGSYNFRVAVYEIPPVMAIVSGPNGTFNWTGAVPSVMHILFKKLNMSYTLVRLNPFEIKKFGTTKAAMNQFVQEDIDLAPGVFVASLERAVFMDFSYPLAMDSYRILSPKPEEESRLFAFIGPFQSLVWTYLLVGAIAVIIFLSFIEVIHMLLYKWEKKRTDRPITCSESFINRLRYNTFFIFGTAANQANWTQIAVTSFRILMASWLLADTVLVNSYSGILKSFLTVPRLKKTINTFEDLAESPDIQVLINMNTVLSQKIMGASTGAYKILGDQLRKNPTNLVASPIEIYQKMGMLHYAYPAMEPALYGIIAKDSEIYQHCRFHLSETIPYSQFGTIGLKKQGKHNQLISYGVMLLWEAGIIPFETKNMNAKAHKCLVGNQKTTRQKSIQISDLISVFFLLAIGTALSVLTLIMEILFKKCRQ